MSEQDTIPQVKQITKCRLCDSDRLTPLFSLGNQYVSDFIDPAKPKHQSQAPINLVLCQNCTLVQLEHTAPQEILYSRHYWYRSGVTDTMRAALRDITRRAEEIVPLTAGDIVLDIGSNDGTLLRSYSVPDLFTVGVEPASNLAEEGAKGIECFINDFWSYDNYALRVRDLGAKVITAIGMFYDLDDPSTFVRDIALALDDDGVFIAQLMRLKDMLDINDIGNFAHEHLEFYSMRSLLKLFDDAGLEIIDLETNSVNGQSTRIISRKKGSKVGEPNYAAIEQRLLDEQGFDDPAFYGDFFNRMEENKRKLVSFIRQEVARGKRVWVYGASTKGNVILQYCGFDHKLIEAAADRSPEKWGLKTVGTNISIVSEAQARESNPDYFLILPYAFLDEFVEREKEWLQAGGKFIVPLPEFRIVGSND